MHLHQDLHHHHLLHHHSHRGLLVRSLPIHHYLVRPRMRLHEIRRRAHATIYEYGKQLHRSCGPGVCAGYEYVYGCPCARELECYA